MVKEVLNAMNKDDLDAIIVSSPENMRYISGFTGEGILFISSKYQVIVTDFRYVISAKNECQGFEIMDAKGKIPDTLFSFIDNKRSRIGFESNKLTVAEHGKWKETLDACEWIPWEGQLTGFRKRKSEAEIFWIEKAEAVGDEAFSRILQWIKNGVTEKEVAWKLESIMRGLGADGLSFDTIAASGIHSSMPHAVPTNKRLEEGDFLTLDFGCKVNGYCSDMTRTIVIGKADQRQKDLYGLVLRAQEAALCGIRPGMKGKEIDALARDMIREAGYGDMFGHGLGHSLGLEIHEEPRFSPNADDIIMPGMVITVEPGVYIEGYAGVRIEDLVLITEKGCRNLTHSSKELIELC